ncbi:MAG: LptF/LptG family permease, partial [Devosiaceae bacterium]|nr:LptF/LptG family permease [Devosiaceae bacterium]
IFVSKSDQNYYHLSDTVITVPGQLSRKQNKVEIAIRTTKAQIQAGQTNASDVSVWGLKDQARRAEESGKNALPFQTRFHALLSQPLLFIAMVLLAGTISLTFARFGLNWKVILGGVLAGFVLYILTKLVVTFGSNGLVLPFIAAWSPAIVASLISVTVLLHQEDG